MDHVQRPDRALIRQSQRMQIPKNQDATTDPGGFNRYTPGQDLLSARLQEHNRFQWAFGVPAALNIPITWPIHPSILPLYYGPSSVNTSPVRLLGTSTTCVTRQAPSTPNYSNNLLQTFKSQGNQKQNPQKNASQWAVTQVEEYYPCLVSRQRET